MGTSASTALGAGSADALDALGDPVVDSLDGTDSDGESDDGLGSGDSVAEALELLDSATDGVGVIVCAVEVTTLGVGDGVGSAFLGTLVHPAASAAARSTATSRGVEAMAVTLPARSGGRRPVGAG